MRLIKSFLVISFSLWAHGETSSPKGDHPPLQLSEKNSTSDIDRKVSLITPQSQKRSTENLRPSKRSMPEEQPKSTSASVSSPASASLRRIKKEYKDIVQMGICYDWVKGRLITSPSTKRDSNEVQLICLGPLATNLRHWHFSFRGVKDSLYESGIYHGRILLPKDYPSSPPRVQLMTPSGRFKPFTDICLSASSYHPESWTPRWTVLSLVHALRLHMLTSPQEIGGIFSKSEETLELARQSLTWKFAWMVRNTNTRIIVDHSKLLEQEVLAIGTNDEEQSDTSAAPYENEDTATSSVMTEANTENEFVIDNETTNSKEDDAEISSTEASESAVEAVQTLEKASEKKQKCRTSKTLRRRTQRQSALSMLLGTIVSTPTGRGLVFLFLIWLCSRK